MQVKKLELEPYGTNCYIVGDSDGSEGIVIDPGGNAAAIERYIGEKGLDIRQIVLTHGHMDHTGALANLKAATGAEVLAHASDAPMMPIQPDRPLDDGDRIEFGKTSLLVLHTPGHSPGCVCLYGENTLFSGDTLFNFGIGRYDFPGGSLEQEMKSIHEKLMVLPGNTRVLPGHGPETTIDTEKRGDPFLRGQI